MKMRRILSAVLVVAMLLSVMPAAVFGITTTDIDTKGTTTGPYDDSELYLGKTATLENDGTYTIRLEAFATGNPVTTQLRSGRPLDIVLVLDQSGSMFTNNYLETLRESVAEFINMIAANGRTVGVTHRVAIVGFASDVDDGSSGNSDNKDHQIAGGSDNRYTNTGVFLEDGSFKNYGDAATSYVEIEGDPVPSGTYYIRDSNRRYQQLTASASYSAVANPSTDRTDLYARVNNTYLPALYADNEYFEVTSLDASETYYIDVNGVKTPITVTSTTTGYTYTQTGNITQTEGQVYYIDTDTSDEGENWITVTYTRSGYSYVWQGSDGNTYSRNGNNGNRYFTRSGSTTRYYAHTRTETQIPVWTLADGTVVDTDSVTVYDLLSGWVYLQNGAFHPYTGTLYEVSGITWRYNGNTYDPDEVQFFEQATTGGLTNEDYRDAMMPVTDGEAGAGNVTEALNIAVSKIAASGATRTSLGMQMAKNVLDNRAVLDDQDERQNVVIVFTDGTPGFSGFEETEANAAMNISADLKAEDGYNATVYTIGLYEGAADSSEISVFMHGLSSNYPTAREMDDVATITYGNSSQNVNFRNMGLTTTPTVINDYVYTDDHYPLRGYVNEAGTHLTLEYYYSGKWNTVNGADNTTDFTHYVYSRTCTEYDTTGKHYMYASDKEKLYDIFPEIITDSTTTTLDQKWLTADTLIRDILETGFVLTNGTTVTMSTLQGTSNNRKITWADAETVIDTLTVTDPSQAVVSSKNGRLSAHNQGGYYFVEATGFDFNKYFFGTSNPAEDSGETAETHATGAKLIITISRVEATDAVAWNQTNLTNNPYSGVWSPVLSDGSRAQIGVFPQPNTYFTDTVAVLDYAKETKDLAAELRQSGVKHLDTDGMNYFASAITELPDAFGNIKAANGKLTYTPNTMTWTGYDTFYVFGNTTDAEIIRHSANKVYSNLWSKVTVIPANNVYYEDTFIETEDKANGVQVGIEFTGEWEQVAAGSNTETPEAGENGGNHGWEDSLADDTGYSDGTAAVGGNGATATFTFAGTGVDIYSRTNMQTGLILASLYEGSEATGAPVRNLLIDNFAHSGDYYMIPTLSIHERVKRVGGKTQYDENGDPIYEALPHGTYTVKLTVAAITNDADFDGKETTRSTYYLDGIRVYNPLAKPDAVVKDAYGEGELNVAFKEVRDILLDADNFNAADQNNSGPVFIDQIINKTGEDTFTEGAVPGTTSDIATYKVLGPENEVYLSENQMIAFAPGNGEQYFVGLKSPTGKEVNVMVTGADGGMEMLTISHTTDLFYPVGTGNNIVTISNAGGELLSVTKIKVAAADTANLQMFAPVERQELLAAADEAYAAAVVLAKNNAETENPEDTDSILELRPSDVIFDLVFRIFDGLRDWFV